MPNILALDSSTDACSVALHFQGRFAHKFELAAKSHTQRLLPMVDEILRESACTLNDLDAIAYGRGPGSFTGLRICMGIVQGLAFGAGLPVVGVSTLRAMALGFIAAHPANRLPILAALDARMDEVYWGLYGADAEPMGDERVMSPQLLADQVRSLDGQFIALGPGWHYADLNALNPETILLESHPNAKDMLGLALDAYAKGEIQAIGEAQPVYLRDSVSWQKRQRIRTQPIG